jgi:SAM-dependent methyltransferase
MIEIHRDRLEGVSDSERAYDRLYGEAFSGWWTGQVASRYLWLVSLLRPRPGRRLLDVSCGNGYMLKAAADAGLETYGLDISPVGIQQASQLAPGVPAVCGDAEGLPFPSDWFDYVTNIGSLEHYLHPDQGAREMARVLRLGGTGLVLVPNAYSLFGNIPYVWRHGDVFVDEQPIQRYGTRQWWTRLLEENGLVVTRTVGYDRELPRTWPDLKWQLAHPTKFLRALLSPLIPINLADSFVFLCKAQR